MKRKTVRINSVNIFLKIIFCVLFSIVSFLLIWRIFASDSFFDTSSKLHWNFICAKIETIGIKEVTLSNRDNEKNIEFSGGILLESEYILSLGKKSSPPTPDNILEIRFSNNSTLELYNWGDSEFSISAFNVYYIIANEELLKQIEKANIG